MKLITLYLPEKMLEVLDKVVREKRCYPNRAEAIRTAIRELLVSEGAWWKPES